MDKIKEILKNLPAKPGVYIMKDNLGNIIYVGKSKTLKNRVRSYFASPKGLTLKTRALVGQIADIEYFVTDNEFEALVLECNLIKQYQPYYNILLKDSKHYPFIKITFNEQYPKILLARKVLNDGAKYFGPYPGSEAIFEVIDTIKRIFKLRTCKREFPRDFNKERPCLNYYINLCSAPCQGNISSEDYRGRFKEVEELLEGRQDELIKDLEAQMLKASNELEFERAAGLRDKVDSLKRISIKQKIIVPGGGDKDVIAVAFGEGIANAQVFIIRNGMVTGREQFWIDNVSLSDEGEVMSGILKQYYQKNIGLPKEILLNIMPDEKELIEAWLSQKKGSKAELRLPKRGEAHKLIEMVYQNALQLLNNYKKEASENKARGREALTQLEAVLGQGDKLSRIEAYDISNTGGKQQVGGMAVFEDGLPAKKEYRSFKLKYVTGQDDYAALHEVVTRRLARAKRERETGAPGGFYKLPGLILADGGMGQAGAVERAVLESGFNIPVLGMVKDDRHRTRGLVTSDGELITDLTPEAFRLIAQIQDEVHRISIAHHRSLRQKTGIKSILEEIPGVGEVRRKKLLKAFKTMAALKEAGVEDLVAVEGIDKRTAEAVYNYFHEKR